LNERKPFVQPVKRRQGYIKLKARRKVNLGKIEKRGQVIWFEKGMIKTLPYTGAYKEVIDQHVKGHFLEVIN